MTLTYLVLYSLVRPYRHNEDDHVNFSFSPIRDTTPCQYVQGSNVSAPRRITSLLVAALIPFKTQRGDCSAPCEHGM